MVAAIHVCLWNTWKDSSKTKKLNFRIFYLVNFYLNWIICGRWLHCDSVGLEQWFPKVHRLREDSLEALIKMHIFMLYLWRWFALDLRVRPRTQHFKEAILCYIDYLRVTLWSHLCAHPWSLFLSFLPLPDLKFYVIFNATSGFVPNIQKQNPI